jgi:hypothetical protein
MVRTRNLIILFCLLIAGLSGVILRSISISPVETAYAESDSGPDAPETLVAMASTGNLQDGPPIIETFNTTLSANEPQISPIADNPFAPSLGLTSTHFPIPWSIADLDATSRVNGRYWHATVTVSVIDVVGNPVTYANVLGAWSDGTAASCTTDSAGRCHLTSLEADADQVSSLTFTVNALVHLESPMYIYQAGRNTDPDSDSNGTAITINR